MTLPHFFHTQGTGESMDTMKTQDVETVKMAETGVATQAPVEAASAPVVKGQFLSKWATTPKRGATRKDKREPKALLAYATEKGERVDLTPEVLAELESRGIKPHRIANAVCGLKKFYGIPVESVRDGRKVVAYVVKL